MFLCNKEDSMFTKIMVSIAMVIFTSIVLYNITQYYTIDPKPKEIIPQEYQQQIKEFIEKEDMTTIDMGVAEDVTIPFSEFNKLTAVMKAKKVHYDYDLGSMVAHDIKIWKFEVEIDPVTNEEKRVIIFTVADIGTFDMGTLNGNMSGNLSVRRIVLDKEPKSYE